MAYECACPTELEEAATKEPTATSSLRRQQAANRKFTNAHQKGFLICSRSFSLSKHRMAGICHHPPVRLFYAGILLFVLCLALWQDKESTVERGSVGTVSLLIAFFPHHESNTRIQRNSSLFPQALFVAAGKDKDHHHEKDRHHVRFEHREPQKIPASDPVFGVVHFTCPPNFTLIEKKCVQTHVASPIISCPYGAYRDEYANCVSVDSVLVERACPPGFESYDKGCIKRHVLDPVATCPIGYHKIPEDPSHCKSLKADKPQLMCRKGVLEGHKCIATQFSEAKPTCPNGFKFNKGRCFRWIKLPPLYTCPKDYTLSTDPKTSKPTCSKVVESIAIPTCGEEFSLEGDNCVKNKLFPKVPKCKEGFALSADSTECTRITASNAVPFCKDGWKYDHASQKCIMVLYEDPLFACPDGMGEKNPLLVQPHRPGEFGIHDCVTVESKNPQMVCERGQPMEPDDADNPRIDAGFTSMAEAPSDGIMSILQQITMMSTKGKPNSMQNSEEGGGAASSLKCLERVVKAPDYTTSCPKDSVGISVNAEGVAVCLHVHNVVPEATCEEGATKDTLPSKGRRLKETHKKVTPEEEEEFKRIAMENAKEENEDYVCSKFELADMIFVCADGSTPSQGFTTCKETRMYNPEYLCPQGMEADKKNNLCLGEHLEDLFLECPAGYTMKGSFNKHGEKPQKIKHVIPPSSNPIPFIEYHGGLQKNIKKYEHKLKKLEEEIYHTGLCERVEYATVQVVCPVGYKMQAKKEKGKGCIAEKPVPPTKICEPGFFMEGGTCVKHVEIAPSLLNLEGNPIACKIRENGGLSCGHSYQYHPEVKEHKLGNGKADM